MARSKGKTTRASQPQRAVPATKEPSALRIKLQIAGAVFVPMLALGLWLNSKGFFG